jgi:hypothetical protein
VDLLVLYYLEWGSQLYITCGESGAISLVISCLTLLDNCCQCSRLSPLPDNETDEALIAKSIKKVVFDVQGGDDEEINESSRPLRGWNESIEEKKERKQREQLLKGLISAVYYN